MHFGIAPCKVNKIGQRTDAVGKLRKCPKVFFPEADVFFERFATGAPKHHKHQQRDEALSVCLMFFSGRRELKKVKLWVKRCARHCHFLFSPGAFSWEKTLWWTQGLTALGLRSIIIISRVPTRTFSVPGFFFWLRPRISSPCRRVCTTGKSERLTNGASTELQATQKRTTSAGGLAEPLERVSRGKVRLFGYYVATHFYSPEISSMHLPVPIVSFESGMVFSFSAAD